MIKRIKAFPTRLAKGVLLRRAKKPGLAPGTLVYTGKERVEPVELTVFSYNETNLEEVQNADESVLDGILSSEEHIWLNVSGIHDIPLIETIGKKIGLHPLIMEDIVSPHQRPKMEVYDETLYIVAKMLYLDKNGNPVKEQISLIVGKNFIISFQELQQDIFDVVRERLRSGKGMMRKMGPDYLAYALLDLIVDHYFILLEDLGTRLEEFEEGVMEHPDKDTLAAIREQKKELIAFRKEIWPLREVFAGMMRDDSGIIKKKTINYIRDVYDHTVQVIDIIETYRDLLAGLSDLYLSSLSMRMNEVMQVLTIIGSIFIPMTFIAGVYGMNFQVMPELSWKYGYFAVWGAMLLTASGLLLFFKRRKWL